MPIYEYRCQQCDHQFDVLQKISDDALTDCPACEQSALKKLISAPNFRLKGGGWYETDFKTDNKRNLADDGKGPDKKTADKKDAGKSDSTSASSSSSSGKSEGGGKSAKSSGDGGKAA